MSISSLKEKGGFLQNEEEQNSCLKAKEASWQTGKNGHAKVDICWRNIQALKEHRGSWAKERFHHGLQSKMQTIKGFENITLNE